MDLVHSFIQHPLVDWRRGAILPLQDHEGWELTTSLALGEPPQNFNAKISTGWADTFVPSVDCAEPVYCDPHRKFSSSCSRTFTSDGRKVEVHDNGIFYTSGVAACDTLHVGGLRIKQQEFELAEIIHPTYFSNPSSYDGPLGLARTTVLEYPEESNLLAQSAFQNMIAQRLLDHNKFAIRYPKPNRSDGEMTLGYMNEDAFSGELIDLPIVDLPVTSRSRNGKGVNLSENRSLAARYLSSGVSNGRVVDEPDAPEDDYVFFSGGWQVEVAAITVGNGTTRFRLDLPGYIAGIITDDPVIALHSNIISSVVSRINDGNLTLPCEEVRSLPDLTFSLVGHGGKVHDFVLTSKDYVSEWLPRRLVPLIRPGECWAPIMRIPDNGDVPPFIMLGSQFLRSFYSVFDADNMTISFGNLKL